MGSDAEDPREYLHHCVHCVHMKQNNFSNREKRGESETYQLIAKCYDRTQDNQTCVYIYMGGKLYEFF